MTDSTPPDETAGPPGLAAAWHAVTGWRRRRPFWGGLLLLVSGAELLMIPLPVHAMGLILHIGTGGVLGILIGAILIACGLLLWFNPAQRIFYSIVAVLLAIAALVASNLGGFLIGTLLGVIGGSLGFAWTPAVPARDRTGGGRGRHGQDDSTSAGLGALLGGRRKTDTTGNDGAILRGYAAFPVVLASLAGLLHGGPAAAAGPSFCLPGIPPIPILNPCPSPSPGGGGGTWQPERSAVRVRVRAVASAPARRPAPHRAQAAARRQHRRRARARVRAGARRRATAPRLPSPSRPRPPA